MALNHTSRARRLASWRSVGRVLSLFGVGSLAVVPLFAGAVCGNGIVEVAEECDDGGLLDLDGCSRTCRYEAIQFVDSLALQGSTGPGFCSPATNVLGGAFSSVALPVLNSTLQDAIDADQLVLLLDLLDLDEATGQNDPAIEVGFLGGIRDPEDPSPGGLDSWYLAFDQHLDPDGRPAQRLSPGAIVALELSAGPSTVSLPFLTGELSLRSAALGALVDGTASLPSPPPNSTAPGLFAFETLDADGTSEGLCGNVTVGSLAAIPIPDTVQCNGACSNSRAYVSCGVGPVTSGCHAMLDLLVGGCRTDLIVPDDCLVEVVAPSQPDVGAGANPPNTLVFEPSGGGIDKVVVVEPDDAFSSWFALTSQRVHATNNLGVIFRDGFESGLTDGWSSSSP